MVRLCQTPRHIVISRQFRTIFHTYSQLVVHHSSVFERSHRRITYRISQFRRLTVRVIRMILVNFIAVFCMIRKIVLSVVLVHPDGFHEAIGINIQFHRFSDKFIHVVFQLRCHVTAPVQVNLAICIAEHRWVDSSCFLYLRSQHLETFGQRVAFRNCQISCYFPLFLRRFRSMLNANRNIQIILAVFIDKIRCPYCPLV